MAKKKELPTVARMKIELPEGGGYIVRSTAGTQIFSKAEKAKAKKYILELLRL